MDKVATGSVAQVPDSINLPKASTLRSNHQPRILHLPLLHKCTHLVQFKQVHAHIIKQHSIDKITDTQLAKLIQSLVESAQMDYAQQVFDEMSQPSTFALNTMVRGYAENGSSNEAIQLYIQMRFQGLEPDNYTFTFLLKACTDFRLGKGVHSLVVKTRNLSSEIHTKTSLLHFYCSNGDIESARLLFDRMAEKNVVTWTAMITGYMRRKKYVEGLALFHQMQLNGVEINELTLVNVLSACANLGMYQMGKWVHLYIDRNRIFLNSTLASALIDMYVKCGYIETALEVFQKMPQKSVSTWNSIIGGLAMHGYGHKALEKFEEMRKSGSKPDDITLIGVLSACGHTGMVEKGKEFFQLMRMDYDIEPKIKHYGCLVDLLCRAGHLDEAYEVIRNMPVEPNGVLWGTLLNACAASANVELAQIAMKQLIKLEPFNDGNYVLMSNIYAKKILWDDVAKMRKYMREKKIIKTPGYSLIEVNNVMHKFMVGDSRHQLSKQINSMLDHLAVSTREEGYVPIIS